MSNFLRRSAQGAGVPHEKGTSNLETVAMPLPSKIVLSMGQHIGAPAAPAVAKGDQVYVGTVVEKSSAEELFEHPLHPYTQGLLSAIPLPVIDQPAAQVILQGEITSPVNPKPGCRFADRCPHATEACTKSQPELKEVSPNHFVACHNLGTF